MQEDKQNLETETEIELDQSGPAAEEAERVAQLAAELAEANDQFLRARAEMENLRRRASEDVQNAAKFAINNFAKELLTVKDSLEMALLDQSQQFDTLKMGVDLTLKQLIGAFDKAQIKEVDPLGQKLDPHLHHAISAEVSDIEPNTVIRVLQKGYTVADRVLRPAMVIVSKAAD